MARNQRNQHNRNTGKASKLVLIASNGKQIRPNPWMSPTTTPPPAAA